MASESQASLVPTDPGDTRVQVKPQFGLRSLFATTTGCCLLLGITRWFGPIASLSAAFVAAMIGLHVAGNLLGARLRASSSADPDVDAHSPDHAMAGFSPTTPTSLPSFPVQRLAKRTGLTWTMAVCSVLGAAVGGGIGSLLLTSFGDLALTWPGLSLGVGSAAVLGAFAGFLATSFFTTTLGAIGEATSELRYRK